MTMITAEAECSLSFFIAKRKGGDEMRKRAPKKGRNTVSTLFRGNTEK